MVTENRRYYWLQLKDDFLTRRNEAHEGSFQVGKKSQSST